MAFVSQHGPTPGDYPKLEALALCPTSFCIKENRGGIPCYTVYRKKGTRKPVSTGGTAQTAWRSAVNKYKYNPKKYGITK